MDIIEGLDSFYLDNDQVIDEQVQAITTIEFYTLVDQRQWHLSGNLPAPFPQLKSFTRFVSRFKQARSKGAMHLDGGTDDVFSNAI
jgi:hypothetical protein